VTTDVSAGVGASVQFPSLPIHYIKSASAAIFDVIKRGAIFASYRATSPRARVSRIPSD